MFRRQVTNEMVDRVLSVFPQMSREDVIRDLSITGSVDLTIDNIINGRLRVPEIPVFFKIINRIILHLLHNQYNKWYNLHHKQ